MYKQWKKQLNSTFFLDEHNVKLRFSTDCIWTQHLQIPSRAVQQFCRDTQITVWENKAGKVKEKRRIKKEKKS